MPAHGACAADGIAGRLEAELLSGNPDCTALERELKRAYRLDEGGAREVLRSVVREVNARLFPPVCKLELILTEACNLACTYCFEKTMRAPRRMSLATARAALDLLVDYSRDIETLEVTLFGGEPTLNFRVLAGVTEHAQRAGAEHGKRITLNMTTNGLLLTPRRVDYLAGRGVKVLLSIDGLQATHDRQRVDKRGRGTFERAIAGLELLKAAQPWVGVKVTVSPHSVHALYDDVVGLHALGVNQFLIGYATGVPWSEEAMQTYAAQSAKLYRWYRPGARKNLRIPGFDEVDATHCSYFGCQAARDSIAVSVTGEISPCSKMLALDSRSPIAKLGDVEIGITHVGNRLRLDRCIELRSACVAAGIASEYRGGCFASNYTDNGDLFAPSVQDHRLTAMQRHALGRESRAGPGTPAAASSFGELRR